MYNRQYVQLSDFRRTNSSGNSMASSLMSQLCFHFGTTCWHCAETTFAVMWISQIRKNFRKTGGSFCGLVSQVSEKYTTMIRRYGYFFIDFYRWVGVMRRKSWNIVICPTHTYVHVLTIFLSSAIRWTMYRVAIVERAGFPWNFTYHIYSL